MDSGTYHGLFTLVLMLILVAIFFWSWSKHNKQRFDDAANLPFADDELAAESAKKESDHE